MRPGIKAFHAAIHPGTEQISPRASLLHPRISFLISKTGTETPHPTYFGTNLQMKSYLLLETCSQRLCQLQCSCTAKL